MDLGFDSELMTWVVLDMDSRISLGGRHIDTAYLYEQRQSFNQIAVGKAVRAAISSGTIKREEMFITSKVNGPICKP